MLGQGQVLLHVADGHGRQVRQTTGELGRLGGQVRGGDRPVDDAEVRGLRPGDHIGGEVEFPRLGRADQVGQEIAAAIVPRRADLGEGRGQLGVRRGDAKVAGERHGQARARGGPGDDGQRRLGHLVQPAAELHPAAQAVDPLVEGGCGDAGFPPGDEALHVTPGAEGPAGPGQHHHPDRRIESETRPRRRQGGQQLPGQGIARLGPVEGQGGHAILEGFDELIGHGAFPAGFSRT